MSASFTDAGNAEVFGGGSGVVYIANLTVFLDLLIQEHISPHTYVQPNIAESHQMYKKYHQ